MIRICCAALALVVASGSAALAQTPAPVPAAYPAIDQARAELCYAHAERDIRRSAAASGRVPGPAWQVRDFWGDHLEGDPREPAEAWIRAIEARASTDASGVEAESVTCAHQALDAREAS